MTQWKKVKIGDVCKIVKGTTGIASAEPGKYPLVVTAEERKTCSTYQFDCEAVCIPLVSSSGHGKKSLKNVHYQSGKFALGTILCAVIPNNPQELDARYLHQYLQFYKDIILVPLMKGAANVSLSMKDIATVEFPLLPIERQRELSNLFVSLQEKHKELSAEFEKQTEYAKLLRQNILQDAIEGKLTADLPCRQAGWRKSHFKNLSGKIVPKTSDKYFAYVLECDDGSLYKGFSQNLFERINRHLEGHGAEWTQKHRPVALIHFEEFKTEKEAVEREKYFKSGSGREFVNRIRNENKLNYDAEALFEQIQKERNAEKKQKKLAPITDEDLPAGKAGKPFDIPEGWCSVKLGEITNIEMGQSPLGDSYNEDGIGVPLINGPVEFGGKNPFDKTVNKKFTTKPTKMCQKDDLLICVRGSTTGRTNIANNEACIGRGVAAIRANSFINRWFINFFVLANRNSFYDLGTGSTFPNVSQNKLLLFKVSLPPLKEQEEIINKVEHLLAKVAELENQIAERENIAKQLMQSILKDAFGEETPKRQNDALDVALDDALDGTKN